MILVDIENYSTRPDRIQGVLRAALREAVERAMRETRITPIGEPGDLGDGLGHIFGPETPKNRLLHPFIPALIREVTRYNTKAPENAHMRLRVVVDAGELRRDDHSYYGSALNDAYLMLDSNELRERLRQHAEWPLVLMISHEVFDGVVRNADGHIDPETYEKVVVHLKRRKVDAWVHGQTL